MALASWVKEWKPARRGGRRSRRTAFFSNKPDLILHAGALRAFWDDYEALRPVNLGSVKELTRLALRRRVPLHLCPPAPIRIYGTERGAQIYNMDPRPVDDTPPNDGTNDYVACKWASERFLSKVVDQFDCPVVLHTPMPTPGAGKHVRPEPDCAFNELVSIPKTLGIRPTMDELDGWADIIHAEDVVSDMMNALFASVDNASDEVNRVLYTGVQRTIERRSDSDHGLLSLARPLAETKSCVNLTLRFG
ncbi:hypothetical protein CC80DRAFT_596043 [Byssothecium circinans]|uniref:Thioester reductase (TE) domain-containing protein n=1 Tax=Byssothecium circinans TaxID=147558 RepID=A0A6A5TN61_9PLEO|nr:hypothetical protein CC80DRAFT_596043 [Byssothecium circinans]